MFFATIYFSWKDGSAHERTVYAETEPEIHERVERMKKILDKTGFRFFASIIQETQGDNHTQDVMLDLLSQDDKIYH